MKKIIKRLITFIMIGILVSNLSISVKAAEEAISGDAIVEIKDSILLSQLLRYDKNNDSKMSVSEMEEITSLGVYTFYKVADLSGLEYAKNLEYLSVNSSRITTLEPLRGLINLKNISIRESEIDSLEPLSELTKLTTISIGSSKIKSLDPLKKITDLTRLEIGSSQIESLEPITNLTKLQYLQVKNSNISNTTSLVNLKTLLTLDISSNPISVLPDISGLDSLWSINVNGTNINDISPVKDMKGLRSLDIGSTKISDISTLKNLNLYTLKAEDTSISDKDKLDFLKMELGDFYKGDKKVIDWDVSVVPSGLIDIDSYVSKDNSIITINDYEIIALKQGKCVIELISGNITRGIEVEVKGIDSNQPLAEKYNGEIQLFKNATLSDGNLRLINNGKDKIVQKDVKKYVSKYVYEINDGISLTLGNDNKLYNASKCIYGDNNDIGNTDLITDNVREVAISKTWGMKKPFFTQVLKNDNSLWVQADLSNKNLINNIKNIDKDVKVVLGGDIYFDSFDAIGGYIKNDGSYYVWKSNYDDEIISEKITTDVKNVIGKLIIKSDGTTWDSSAKNKILDTSAKQVVLNTKRLNYPIKNESFILDVNNNLWSYAEKYDGNNELKQIASNVSSMNKNIYTLNSGKSYTYDNLETEYKEIEDEYVLGKNNTLYKNGTPLLTDVLHMLRIKEDYNKYQFRVVRSDGSIWEINNVPKKIADAIPSTNVEINYDIDGNGTINMLDLAIVGQKYNVVSSSSNYNAKCDFNKDNIIDIYDIAAISKRL